MNLKIYNIIVKIAQRSKFQYCPNRSHTNTGAQPGPETKQQIDAGVKHQAGAHAE
jgi:hypothetical protein